MAESGTAAPIVPILARLKKETRTHHERVEAALDLPSRIASFRAYESLLACLYGLYRPLETSLTAASRRTGPAFDWSPRWKTPLLVADLHSLGWSGDRIAALPLCTKLPRLDTTAQAAGCAYVLEGATLGGQIIRGEVARALPLHDAGVQFFTGYGEQTRAQWLAFGTALNEFVQQHPDSADEVVRSAEETFVCFEHWLLGAGR